MTPEKAAKMVGLLLMYYPGVEISEETIKAYALALSGLDEERALEALPRVLAECKFFPSVNEILRITAEVDGPPTPEEAWGEVIRKVNNVGSYGRPTFSHELIDKAVRTVGWLNICLSETPGVERAHFFRVYETFRERTLKDQMRGVAADGLTKALLGAWGAKAVGTAKELGRLPEGEV